MLSVPLDLSNQRRFTFFLDSVPKSQYTFTSSLNIFGEFDIRYSKESC